MTTKKSLTTQHLVVTVIPHLVDKQTHSTRLASLAEYKGYRRFFFDQ
jgi:hypothetical protein